MDHYAACADFLILIETMRCSFFEPEYELLIDLCSGLLLFIYLKINKILCYDSLYEVS
jgi:hypothetical protein